ncbi:hypothetical protein J14TS2_22310 [Bacillus sp. J14TS2]|nr:hypothetical protein J14TS2_22310 [Bacillus sp. J14TS2]
MGSHSFYEYTWSQSNNSYLEKRKAVGKGRQANVPEPKKGVFPFRVSGLFDLKALSSAAGQRKSESMLTDASRY